MHLSQFFEEDVWVHQRISEGKAKNYNCPLCQKFKGGTKWKLRKHLKLTHIKQSVVLNGKFILIIIPTLKGAVDIELPSVLQ